METNGLVIGGKSSCSKFMFECNKLRWIWILDNVTDRSVLTCSFGIILFALKRKIRPLTANVKTSNANMRETIPKGVNYFLLIWSYFFVSSKNCRSLIFYIVYVVLVIYDSFTNMVPFMGFIQMVQILNFS